VRSYDLLGTQIIRGEFPLIWNPKCCSGSALELPEYQLLVQYEVVVAVLTSRKPIFWSDEEASTVGTNTRKIP
jgi:hypothetical protein